MNTVNALPFPYYSSSSSSLFITKQCNTHYCHYKTSPQLSFSTKRRRSSRTPRRPFFTSPTPTTTIPSKKKSKNHIIVSPSIDNQSVNFVLDLNQLQSLAVSSFNSFLSSGKEAFTDLQTFITVDDNRRLVVSCRKSTVHFFGSLVVWGCVVVVTLRVFLKLGFLLGLRFRNRFVGNYKKPRFVVRRDRSLGGREVIVAIEDDNDTREKYKERKRVLDNPLSLPGQVFGLDALRREWKRQISVTSVEKLPKWWPVSVANEQILMVDQEEYKREANRLIRVIIDHRTSGKDIMDDDIIQLRRKCRTSGVRVSIDTANTRDAIYRTAIEFVLNFCSRAPSHSTSIEIDGEDCRQFIAGLADNIGLENFRAARMVSAAVAARTRSRFLQAWALELQGKHSEAAWELSRVCLILRIFPPEKSSAEMEMVARGLAKHLKVEQRKLLMNMIVEVCCEESQRRAAEALGLMLSSKGVGEHPENKYR